MNSIRKKLFIYIGALVLLLVGFIMLVNSLLLQPYYVERQKDALLGAYESIDSLNTTDYENHIKDFLVIENNQRIDIAIWEIGADLVYATRDNVVSPPLPKLNSDMPPLRENEGNNPKPPGATEAAVREIIRQEIVNDNLWFSWVYDPEVGAESLVLVGTLEDNYHIEMTVPIAAIESTVNIVNNFTLIIGGIVFIIAMVFAFVISNTFTKPIIKMNDTTKQLKHLNFNSKCDVKSNDEIGQLAQSINDMSLSLKKNINSLNEEIDAKTRLNEKRKELLNNVSHELKTPLALMQGYAEGLKLHVSKGKAQSDFYCDVIMDEAKKMNNLVERLLNLNQVEFGDVTLNKMEFEIHDFVYSILQKYDKVFEDENIDCRVNTGDPAMVFADEFMTESVFTNYLNNAKNYVDENKRIEITVENMGDTIRISVYNTAPNFTDEDINKIWGSFYKVDKMRTREKGGHGLGLSIVKAIQEAHGSEYGVSNTDGGVVFWFEVRAVDSNQ